MARERGIRYFHVFYDAPPEKDGDPPRPAHDLKNGPECWCEPRSFRSGPTTIVVVHDPVDWLTVVEDSNGRNPHYPEAPYTGDPGP